MRGFLFNPRTSTPENPKQNAGGAGNTNGGGGSGDDEARLLLLGHHLVDFWCNICLCHSLIVEEAEDGGPPIYQARPRACIYSVQVGKGVPRKQGCARG